MTTALLTHPACLSNIIPPGHPEQVARLERVLAALDPLTLQRQAAPMAAEDDLLRLHPQHHLDGLREAQPTTGQKALDGDTFLSPGSLEAAYRGAGDALKAVDIVLSGQVHKAFCAIRPPPKTSRGIRDRNRVLSVWQRRPRCTICTRSSRAGACGSGRFRCSSRQWRG